MKFKYLGEAPDGEITQCGVVWKPNEVSEVSDEADVEMLKGHPLFEAVGDSEPVPMRKSKPRKPVIEPDEPLTEDEPNDGNTY